MVSKSRAYAPTKSERIADWFKRRVALPEFQWPKRKTPRDLTWDEVIRHDKKEDCWIVIHGKVYDVTEWCPKHPGGSMIYEGAGGDCTAMWLTYHPLSLIDKGVPDKYFVGTIRDHEELYNYEDELLRTLKKRVEAQIPKERRRSDIRMTIKCFYLVIAYLLSLFCYIKYCTVWSVVLMAWFGSQVALNIMHDGNHMAFNKNWKSTLASWTMELLGASGLSFSRAHNFGHHQYTNHTDHDGDLGSDPAIVKLHSQLQQLGYHKYQHIYAWILYNLLSFFNLIRTFDRLFAAENLPKRRMYAPIKTVIAQVLIKIVWIFLTLLLPSRIHGFVTVFPIWIFDLCLFSYGYGLLFIINHYTMAANFDTEPTFGKSWAKSQIESSINFAIGSEFWFWVAGGLNYQAEHHLFPSYIHTRLPEIHGIIYETCKEFDIRYNIYPGFWDAVVDHYRLLKYEGGNK